MNSLNCKKLIIVNLNILGFNSEGMSKVHNVAFNKSTFNVPNKKAFELVSYFLFCKLSSKNVEKFRPFWPIIDQKYASKFRSLVNELIKEVLKEKLIPFPNYSPSLLLSPGGDKFINLYYCLTLYVMIKLSTSPKSEKSSPMLVLPENKLIDKSLSIKSIDLSSHFLVEDFISKINSQAKRHEVWIKMSNDLQRMYRKLDDKAENKQSEFSKSLEEFNFKTSKKLKAMDIKQSLQEHEYQLEKIHLSWSKLAALKTALEDGEDIINHLLKPESNDNILKADNILPIIKSADLPYAIKDKFSMLEDKLNLSQLVSSIDVIAQVYHDIIAEDKIPELSEPAQKLKEQAEHQHHHLTSLQNMRNNVEKILPVLQNSVQNLKVKIEHKDCSLQNTLIHAPELHLIPGTSNSNIQDSKYISEILSSSNEMEKTNDFRNTDKEFTQKVDANSGTDPSHNNSRIPTLNKRTVKSKLQRKDFLPDELQEYINTPKLTQQFGYVSAHSKNDAVDILVDKIVDDYMNDKPDLDPAIQTFIDNPLKAMEPTAFASKNLISKTPPSKSSCTDNSSVTSPQFDEEIKDIARAEIVTFDQPVIANQSQEHSFDDKKKTTDEFNLSSSSNFNNYCTNSAENSLLDIDDLNCNLIEISSGNSSVFETKTSAELSPVCASQPDHHKPDDISNLIARFSKIKSKMNTKASVYSEEKENLI